MSLKRGKPWIKISSRILSCIAAIVVLYFEAFASMGNKKILFGAISELEHSSTYTSDLVIDFVKLVLNEPNSILAQMHVINDQAGFIYVDKSENKSWTLSSKCQKVMEADHLYNVDFLNTYLNYALAETSLNISTHWIVVDCTYDGRTLPDSSCLKVHLLDKQMKNFYTFVAQTVSVYKKAQSLLLNGVVAIMGNMSLSSARVSSDLIVTNESASYFVSVGFNLHEMANFVAVNIDEADPPDAMWHGQVKRTGEELLFYGTTGIYRTSPNTQGVYYSYYWILPNNPVEYLNAIHFKDRYVMKDIWGWFRCFLGLGIGSNIAMNFLIALIVMKNIRKRSGIVWIPDMYPAIQKRAAVRAGLLLLDCFVNSWWYPMMYALNQGRYRRNTTRTCFMSEIPRADGLMVCLGITYYLARYLKVRMQLHNIVAVYCVCFFLRVEIIDSFGLFIDYANADLDARYLENIIPVEGGLDLWAYHDDHRVDYKLLANEFTWLLWAVVASVLNVLLIKASARWSQRKVHGISFGSEISSKSIRVHWSGRSLLYDTLTEADQENTRIERSVGKVVGSIFGFVASTSGYQFEDRPRVSMSGVWLLGYVIVDDRYLVRINDYAFLLLNCCFGRSYFHVHGFLLESNAVAMDLVRIYYNELRLREVFNVTLEPLE